MSEDYKMVIEVVIDEEAIKKDGYDPRLYLKRKARELKSEFKGKAFKDFRILGYEKTDTSIELAKEK